MKILLWILPLLVLLAGCARLHPGVRARCAGLRPYGGGKSVRIALDDPAEDPSVVTLDRLPDGLLVTFDVNDSELVVRPEEKIWMSDSVEFYADLRAYRERTLLNGYARGVFQIIAAPPAQGRPVRCEIISRGFPVPEGFSSAGCRTPHGYRIQMFLPEASFREIHGPFRDTLYMDASVNHVNGGGGNTKVFWKGNDDNWQYPHNFAPVTFP